MQIFEDDDDDPAPALEPERALAFLHGLWRDEVRGSTICIRAGRDGAWTVYCSSGDHEFTGRYTNWEFHRGQFFASFRWNSGRFNGVIVLQPRTKDLMAGGWWHSHDLTRDTLRMLPFAPGINPCRWVRQDPKRAWPLWAAQALGLPIDGSVTSESLATAGSIHSSALPKKRGRTSESSTAEGRYHQRLARWIDRDGGVARLSGRLAHHSWWLLHNLVAHPLLALAAIRWTIALHDWTSRRLNRDESQGPSPAPRIERRFWWLVHNLAAHPAIGLVPCATTFRWHDVSARRMRVPNWA